MAVTPAAPQLVIGAGRDQRSRAQRSAAVAFTLLIAAMAVPGLVEVLLTGGWVTLAIEVGSLVVVASILFPLVLVLDRRRRVVVQRAQLRVYGFAGRHRQTVDVASVASMTLLSTGLFSGRRTGVSAPLILLVGRDGSCVARLQASRFTEADAARLAQALGIPIRGSYADILGYGDVRRLVPGALTKREIRLIRWAAPAIAVGVGLQLLSLAIYIGTALERTAQPPLPSPGPRPVLTASSEAPGVTLPFAGRYLATYTVDGCAVAAPHFNAAVTNAAPGMSRTIATRWSAAGLGPSGIFYAAVATPETSVVFNLAAPPGCVGTWTLSLLWVSSSTSP